MQAHTQHTNDTALSQNESETEEHKNTENIEGGRNKDPRECPKFVRIVHMNWVMSVCVCIPLVHVYRHRAPMKWLCIGNILSSMTLLSIARGK